MANVKHQSLLAFYQKVLETVDLKVDEEGFIAFQPAGAIDKDGKPLVIQAAVEGKRWVLPTDEVLSENHWDELMAFHPLSENFLNGESAVLAKFKAAINLKLGAVIGEILGALTKYASDVDAQKNGNVGAKASKYLKLVPHLKEVSAERMAQIIEKTELASDRRFVNLYLKRGGMLNDTKHTWVCVVGFPFRQELDGEEPKVFGVTISKKDQASFKALFDYILPDNDDLAQYSSAPKAKSAAKFDALLRAFANVAIQLNEMVQTHRKQIPSYKDLMIDLSWMEELDAIDKMADVVPPLPGNVGEGVRDGRVEGAVKQSNAPVRAKRMFEQAPAESRTEREVIPHKPETLRDEPRGERQAPAGQAPARDPENLTFSERMRRQAEDNRQQRQVSAGYQRSSSGYGSRNYAGTARDQIPPWMEEGGSSRVVAGSPPREEQGRYGSREAMHDRPAGSFSDRMRGQSAPQRSYGGRGGSFQV